jgi:hypothetical protein
MKIKEIYIGGWFQRTSLHLNEIYNFLKNAESKSNFSKKKLQKLQKKINPQDVKITLAELDYVSFKTKDGISVRIYEDGLTTLGLDEFSDDMKKDFKKMTDFYEKSFSEGISYIFSLGAPVPKDLAKIENVYPYFVVLDNESEKTINSILEEFQEKKYTTVNKKTFKMVQGGKIYIFNNKTSTMHKIRDFIEETIFLREFQSQLERYLNLHRNIWEKIAAVKEKGSIKGSEVNEQKTRIESYSKTINLIEARISQMNTYIHTRENITKAHIQDKDYREILEYRYETLSDSLSYVSDL